MRPDAPRPLIAGPPIPSSPFPLRLSGPIVKGFGRGSLELGIPTANIPIAGLSVGGNENVESGVYYGWAGVDVDEEGKPCRNGDNEGGEIDGERETNWDAEAGAKERNGNAKTKAKGNVWPMVMSIGWNPYYKNTRRSVEVHILHHFPHDFYGAQMNLLICGFIRPEYDYVSKESLIEDIRTDIEVARRSLEREGYRALRDERWLMEFKGVEEEAS